MVFARVSETGELAADPSGRVEIIYKLAVTAKIYRASARNLAPAPDDAGGIEYLEVSAPAGEDGAASGAKAGAGSRGKAAPAGPLPKDAIIVYTDGACTGNPGPAGIGAVLIDGTSRQELSRYLGEGTNNIAELTAILDALEAVPPEHRSRAVVIHSDSNYAIGLLSKGWKPKANQELVAKIRSVTKAFGDLRFVKVKGHAGVPENERCDELARQAVSRRR